MGENETFSIIIAALDEEEHVENLVRSIFKQTYRPIEVIFVDDGSKDKTLHIVKKLKEEFDQKDFSISILETRKSNKGRGPAAAWNLGLSTSKGRYVLFLPGDAKLTKKDTLEIIGNKLPKNQIVGFKFKPIIDNSLESNISFDYHPKRLPFFEAYQSEMIKKTVFDSNLGVGEDWDLPQRLEKSGLIKRREIVETEIGFHYPHTYKEYSIQRFWRGRTVWPLLRKYPNFDVFFSRLVFPTSPFGLFFLAIISLVIDVRISILLATLFLGIVIYLFMKSPVRNANRFFHILLVRSIFGSLLLSLGSIYGFYQYFIKREFTPGRSQLK